ncbi:hypothetical protein [Oscillatoria sp. FACHB-1406]|uniref:hypothetical protein n=1 Tax=Oscillatoria sp. FACHB-1406 TaxID=2692846 RepID=UPI0016853410|nr:hypothetical protein [Oscillatoria sp. FACHB-1406]MBD2577379.1 hypothetical protein [Oscillatoria sp. FACHB-1406]
MKVKGIIRGNTIELLESLSVLDGLEIFIEIPDDIAFNSEQKWEQIKGVIGAWKDDEEISNIFQAIDEERHADLGQPLNFDSLN